MVVAAGALSPPEALQKYFGFPEFRPGQEAAIRHALAGRDTLVVMPTGSGKSLIYQLAALLLPGTALVISPLVALMKDQVDGLVRRGIAATFVNSSLAAAEQSRRLRGLAAGDYKIILVAPERLRSRPFREALAPVALSLLVVDEAHCLSQWGHDFRPDYLHVAEARREFGTPVTLALTATATPRVQDDIVRLLGLARPERLVTGFNRPNLALEVISASNASAKLNLVRELLAEADGAGIIYTGTRREAEEVAAFARDACGIQARHYHGTLEAATRAETQDAFMAGDVPLVVATNAFGMGIDRPDVRFVLHYSLPGSLEAYYQEAGRAGRDGLPARAVLLYSPKDTALHEFFIENDTLSAAELRRVHEHLRGLPPDATGEIRTVAEAIEAATGVAQVKLRVALDQLQAAGGIQRGPDDAYGVIRLRAMALPEAALKAVAAQAAARRDLKRQQLDHMLDYAQTNDCRRRRLLDHFGDSSPADAPVCCDNCLARGLAAESETRAAETQSERAALIVLDAIAKLNWEVGKGKLAQMLKGSSAAEMAPYRGARYFGKFAALPLTHIEGLVDQLLTAGFLKQVGGKLPTLKLAPKGEAALMARAAIQVDLRSARPERARRPQAQRGPGDTVAETGRLLKGGLAPEQIAAARAMTVSTIYSHLAQLIADGRVEVSAVVPDGVRQAIWLAVEAEGSSELLAPLKARLPPEVEYNVIRCAVNGWRREHGESDSSPATLSGPLQEALFERLRAWRLTTARAQGVPSFVVFSDAVLRQIAATRPRSSDDLLALHGIGKLKAEKYGTEVLALVAANG